MEVGLALSGGGIKGAAHIGAIKAIKEEKINIKSIAGTSSGSIVASMYAMGYNTNEMLEYFKEYSKKIKYIEFKNIFKLIYGYLLKNKLIITGLNSGEVIEDLIREIGRKKRINNISQFNIPIYIPCVDIKKGIVYYFTSEKNSKKNENKKYKYVYYGDIGKIVRASCSYPVIFSPVKYLETELIDGGIRENLPWKILKENGVKEIIAIGFEKELNENCCSNIIDVINNSLDILCDELENYENKGIDYIVKIKTKNIGLLDKNKIDYLYRLGYETTKRELKKFFS